MRFLNEEREVGPGDWDRADWPKLWLYNLHYFDVLHAAEVAGDPSLGHAVIDNWLGENPPAHGTGWEPYPLSLRIVNWIKWTLDGNALAPRAHESLAVQARHLARRLEWHLLGNHLFENAKALVYVGLYFDGPEAEGWLATGLRILAREMPEQILADGGHFELSPMYHSIVLEDVLDLVNVARAYAATPSGALSAGLASWMAAVPAMLDWLDAMCHPDGGIAFFNDAAFGIAPAPADIAAYARRLGFAARCGFTAGLKYLRESGYVSARLGPAALIFDAAPVGPQYLTAHAHADTLSFELSWQGRRIICNSGTSRYGTGSVRDWERSTRAHNTVEIDAESSSEVWHGFRVARRARPFDHEVSAGADAISIACSHDGYSRLAGRPVHRREITMRENELVWIDRVEGRGPHRVCGRITLHPDVSVRDCGDRSFELGCSDGTLLRLDVSACDSVAIERGTYAPEFGCVVERPVIAWAASGALPVTTRVSLRAAAPR